MSAGSVSKIDLILSLNGKVLLNFELKRHLAPKTVGTVLRSLPVASNAHMMGTSIAFMDTAINAGGEKLRTRFKKGDVAFMASNNSICFFIDNVDSTKSMTLMGKIESDVEMLRNIKPGDIFSITQAGV